MEQYILPLFCLLLNFVAVIACLRFLLSREGLFWISPLILSLLMFFQNGSIMYADGALVQPALTAGSAIDALLAIFWYLIVITFHYALKKRVREDNYEARVRKDLNESHFLLKVEQRQAKARAHKRRVNATGSAVIVSPEIYPESWSNSFDEE